MNIRTTNPWRPAHAPDSQTTRGFFRRLLASILCCLTLSAGAATRSWTSPGGTNLWLWSDPANWDPQGVPQNGEDLRFSDPLSADQLMFNDLPNLTVRSLKFDIADIGDASVHLYGATPLGVSQGISNTNHFECQVYIHCGLRLAGNATFVTGNTEFTSAVFAEETRMHLIGPIDLNGYNLVLKADAGIRNEGRLFVEGGISGSGNVVGIAVARGYDGFDYPGILEFKGAGNDFSGTLTLNPELDAEIRLNVSSGVVVNDLLIVTNVGTVKLTRPEQIGDGATVRITDGATLQLNNFNETIQHLELINDSNDALPSVMDTGTNATLSLQGNITAICNNGNQTPAIKGKLNLLSGSHVINVSGSAYAGLDIQAVIDGAGGFSKFGNAALLLTGANTFDGTVSAVAGVIDVSTPSAFGSTARGVTLNGGSISLRNLSINGETLFVRGQQQITPETAGSLLTSFGASAWTGAIELDTNLVVYFGDMTLSGYISGPGGLALNSGGTVQIGGTFNNTYTGTTLVRCPVLELNKPFGVHAYAGPLVVGDDVGGPYEVRWFNTYQNPNTPLTLYANGIVNLGWSNVVENFGPVIFNGGSIQTGTGIFVAENSITVNPSAFTATINGNLALGIAPFNFTIGDGIADPDLLINAVISGSSLVKQGPGRVIFANANTYIGATTVAEGILQVQNPDGLGSTGAGTIVQSNATLTVGGSTAEPITINGHGVGGTPGALFVTAGATKTLSGPVVLGSPSTIHVVTNGSLAISGIVSGTGPLTKAGAGALIFAGAGHNNFSGDTVVAGGTLAFQKNSSALIAVPGNLVVGPPTSGAPTVARLFQSGGLAGSSTVTVNAGSLLDLNGFNLNLPVLNLNDGGDVQTGSGQLSFAAGGVLTVGTLNPPEVGLRASSSISGKIGLPESDYLTFNVGGYGPAPLVPDPELVVSAAISGVGNIVKNGFGGMLFSGNNTFNSSAQILAGDILVNGGTLLAGSAAALGGTAGWTFVNNDASLALINGITINNETLYLNSTRAPALDNRGGSNTWTGPMELSRDTSIGVNADWALQTLGVISGAGSLTKIGAGTLRIGGNANNTHVGNTFVHEGTLLLAKSSFVQAVPHDLIIGSGSPVAPATLVRYLGDDQVWNRITINANGLLDLDGFDEISGDLTLNGGGDVQTTAFGIYYLAPNANLIVNPGTANNAATITGNFTLYAGQHIFTINGGVTTPGQFDLNLQANVYQMSGSASILKAGAGRLRLGGTNDYRGITYVSGGILQVDGHQPRSVIEMDHDTGLRGSGTVGHVLFNGGGLVVAPGNSAGSLTCSNLDASGGNGKLEMELNGHPTGYDQIVARGLVDLRGLALQASLNFVSSTGQQFTLINNDGIDEVTGTFDGLPQNAPLTIGNESFVISYTGDTGNDVVLTRLVTPPRPRLTIERIPPASVRLSWATNNPPFRLLSHTNLSTTNWISASPQPTTVGTNHVVTNAISGSQKFYRLINP